MLQWFVAVNRLLRSMRAKASDALSLLEKKKDAAGAKVINGYLSSDFHELYQIWESQGFDTSEFGYLGRHIAWGMANDYKDMLTRDIPQIEAAADKHIEQLNGHPVDVGFDGLLHPIVRQHALHHYRDGNFREAVLNSVVAVFDMIRKRTGLDKDGAQLVAQTFSLDNPYLIFSDINSESGQNDQKGFFQILQGTYLGIRNPKAHSLDHDLNETKAAQYLVFASLLARRVDEAREGPAKPKTKPKSP